MNRKSTSNLKTFLIYIAVFIVVIFIISQLMSPGNKETLKYSDIQNYFYKGEVESFFVSNKDVITLTLKETDPSTGKNKKVSYELKSTEYFREDLGELINEQIKSGELTEAEYEPPLVFPWWVSIIPYVLLLVGFAVIYLVMVNQMVGKNGKMNSFGKARVKTANDTKEKVTFDDVAGAEEEKEELKEIVDFLKDPKRFGELGAKIPHGVLLMGPPGTGKTLLAKAVAGEADVPFFSISGSDFVEMYVGVGASRVRDLFETARKAPASIVFIDEIDAVGRHRGAGLGGGHDEREQTLNQLLVEMDGFGAHEGIIVMAATNRPDILDPALLRPGRFDRQITVNYPDINGREQILRVHARNKKFEPDVDFSVIAKTTSGFTGADLANLLNEAALLAVRRGKSLIGMPEIEDSFLKVVSGPQKKSLKLGEKEKKNTAYHEAGHAITAYYLPTSDPVHTISIIPAGQTLGVTVYVPAVDKYSVYKKELEDRIAVLLGGRAAETLIFGDFSGGAANDIKRATETAHKMVTQLGMSELLGPIRYGSSHGDDIFLGRDFSSTQDYSDETAAKIDAEVRRIITEALEKTNLILTEHKDKLVFVAEFLVSHETMDADQFRAAMESDSPSVEELERLLEEKKARSSRANSEERTKNEAASGGESADSAGEKSPEGSGEADVRAEDAVAPPKEETEGDGRGDDGKPE